MLLLTRHIGESIIIGEGKDIIVVTIVSINRNQVRIGVEAPKSISVHREEIYERIQKEQANTKKNYASNSSEEIDDRRGELAMLGSNLGKWLPKKSLLWGSEMFGLAREPGQSMVIGNNIQVMVVSVCNGIIKLGIEAPEDVKILREEIYLNEIDKNIINADKTRIIKKGERYGEVGKLFKKPIIQLIE